jgi:hypothetical protein
MAHGGRALPLVGDAFTLLQERAKVRDLKVSSARNASLRLAIRSVVMSASSVESNTPANTSGVPSRLHAACTRPPAR